ncbi:MAG: DUF4097 family beta strand repeat protein [Candidatus Latescibacterota bacterium]|nr:MAG: DUF4097 family beta strand repeat protein [Candidatus Latescibacterota bacterium]
MLIKTTAAMVAILMLFGATEATAQEDSVDRVTLELSDPSKPAFLSVGLVNGGITVTGHDGSEVVVEAKTQLRKIDKSSSGEGKSTGMTRIPVSSSSLTVEEFENKIEIDTESWAHPVDLVIRVPKNTSLDLSCVNQGDILVENITGDIEVSNVNGSVTLRDIEGSAVAGSHNGDLVVTFKRIDSDKDMSFSSFNGDVDVAFPASLKAKVKLKTVQGDIYTDFEVKEIENPERIVRKNHRDSGGKYQVSVERAFWGSINGGGQVLQFSNYNGDIYIRKQK